MSLRALVVAGALSGCFARLSQWRGLALPEQRELQGWDMSTAVMSMDMGMENMSNMTTMPPTMYSPDMGCGDDKTCFSYQYNKDGTLATDDMGKPLTNITCVPWSSSCPCNPMWEVSCSMDGYPFCWPLNVGSCPVSCGSNATCYSWNGTQSCGTGANGMSCVRGAQPFPDPLRFEFVPGAVAFWSEEGGVPVNLPECLKSLFQ